MIKRVSIHSLPEGVDPDKFWKYHTEVHASDITKAAGPRLKRCLLNRVRKVESGEPKFFGLIELWFESEEAMNGALNDFRTLKALSYSNLYSRRTSELQSGLMPHMLWLLFL